MNILSAGRWTLVATFFSLALLLSAFRAKEVPTGKLHITVNNLRSNNGTVRIYVYQEKNFLVEGKMQYVFPLKIQNYKAIGEVELPAGAYAFAMIHDENGNTTMDYNWAKMPSEGWGFSNRYTALIKPSFNQCSFHIQQGQRTLQNVVMQYLF